MKKTRAFILPYILALFLSGCGKEASSIGIIGGADGPTAIFVTSEIDWLYVCGVIAAIAVGVFAVLIIWRKKK